MSRPPAPLTHPRTAGWLAEVAKLAEASRLPHHDPQRTAAWAAVADRWDCPHVKLDPLATAGNFAVDMDTIRFGAACEVLADIDSGTRTDFPRKGEVLRFIGWGCLPYDGINDWFFERMDGTPVNTEFYPNMTGIALRDRMVWPGDTKPATIRPIPLQDERAEMLHLVGGLLRAVRADLRAED